MRKWCKWLKLALNWMVDVSIEFLCFVHCKKKIFIKLLYTKTRLPTALITQQSVKLIFDRFFLSFFLSFICTFFIHFKTPLTSYFDRILILVEVYSLLCLVANLTHTCDTRPQLFRSTALFLITRDKVTDSINQISQQSIIIQ